MCLTFVKSGHKLILMLLPSNMADSCSYKTNYLHFAIPLVISQENLNTPLRYSEDYYNTVIIIQWDTS